MVLHNWCAQNNINTGGIAKFDMFMHVMFTILNSEYHMWGYLAIKGKKTFKFHLAVQNTILILNHVQMDLILLNMQTTNY